MYPLSFGTTYFRSYPPLFFPPAFMFTCILSFLLSTPFLPSYSFSSYLFTFPLTYRVLSLPSHCSSYSHPICPLLFLPTYPLLSIPFRSYLPLFFLPTHSRSYLPMYKQSQKPHSSHGLICSLQLALGRGAGVDSAKFLSQYPVSLTSPKHSDAQLSNCCTISVPYNFFLPTLILTFLPTFLSTFLSIFLSTFLPIFLLAFLSTFLSVRLVYSSNWLLIFDQITFEGIRLSHIPPWCSS